MEGSGGGNPAPQAWQAEQDEVFAASHPSLGGEACLASAQACPMQGCAAGSSPANHGGVASTLDVVKGRSLHTVMRTSLQAMLLVGRNMLPKLMLGQNLQGCGMLGAGARR